MKKKLFFLFTVSICLCTTLAAASADTSHVFEINGQRIAHFDGSALVGKTIASYRIQPLSTNNSETTVMLHAIATTDSAVTKSKKWESYVYDGGRFFKRGETLSLEEAMKKYPEMRNKKVVRKLKRYKYLSPELLAEINAGDIPDSLINAMVSESEILAPAPLCFVNGKKFDGDLGEVALNIKSVTIIKDPERAKEACGMDAPGGVILITLKNEQ